MVQEITKKNAVDILEKSGKPVVVDVFAAWCGPCMQVKPIFAQLASELGDQYTFAALNVDEERDLAIQHGITSIPTFLFFKNNKLVGKETGYMSKDDLLAKIRSYLA